MPLTIIEINQAKTDGATLKLRDKDGLYLRVTKKTKGWRFDFRFDNRRYTISYGLYPTVSLAKARELHQEARQQLAEGINPAFRKRLEKLGRGASFGNSFEATARNWYEGKQEQRSRAWREAHGLYLRRDLNPYIGDMPLSQVDARGLLNVLEKIRIDRGVKIAERVRQTAVQVFDHGMRKQKIQANPARVLQGWADIPREVSHEPLREDEIHEFVERLDADTGSAVTKLCILLMLLTFVRKNEIVQARWIEIDLDNAVWVIPAARMKMRDPHVVPLSRQAIAALEELKPLSLGSDFLFPSLSTITRPMGLSTPNVVFERMGYGGRFTPHGIRATASTFLNNRGVRADVIERQLAHVERNRVRAAYNRADYMSERVAMMQMWADFVLPDQPTTGDSWVAPLPQQRYEEVEH
ncbi:tyrosine-type recombinase/integrase [Burkholderia pseudomallei]|uniref:tyrosine-type recombinase/integrase n=1 Tax=Burkholderia pseudomallei TaxID=28450 RepID=UPI00053824B5|nr:tyrosine-type recombinase/integrase [Burkholderia pseudomallei]KGX30395.1 phage integrase family protein [Burkholderia pseudomallei MSHR2138]KGX47808.1 phage integrase family protein [Burkholderia pseudomallei MSHR3709]